jgi:hypothetical protein
MLINTLFTHILPMAAVALPFESHSKVKRDDVTDLILRLRDAITAAKTNIIAEGGMKSFVFDFVNPPPNSANKTAGGLLITAKEKTFPPLAGIPVSLAVNTIAPCGYIQPHVHPRATEMTVVVQGKLMTQYIAETGAIMVTNELPTFSSTLFPQGAIHTSFNPYCEEAKAVSAFTSNDAGIHFVATNFFGMDDDLVTGTLGGERVLSKEELATMRGGNPGNPFLSEECMVRCGFMKSRKRRAPVKFEN